MLYNFFRMSFCIVLITFLRSNVFALSISPTMVILTEKEPIATLALGNEKDTPTVIQLSLVTWKQLAGKDVYTPTRQLIATPQIFTLAAHTTQLIRVAMDGVKAGNTEKAYRFFIQEVIPDKQIRRNTISNTKQLTIAIRLSLPVIIKAITPEKQNLVWSYHANQLTAKNTGNTVVFINQLQVFSRTNKALMKPLQSFTYLLPGSNATWAIQPLSSEKIDHIKTNVNNQMLSTKVNLAVSERRHS